MYGTSEYTHEGWNEQFFFETFNRYRGLCTRGILPMDNTFKQLPFPHHHSLSFHVLTLLPHSSSPSLHPRHPHHPHHLPHTSQTETTSPPQINLLQFQNARQNDFATAPLGCIECPSPPVRIAETTQLCLTTQSRQPTTTIALTVDASTNACHRPKNLEQPARQTLSLCWFEIYTHKTKGTW